MPTSYTSLLGLALPVTGELSGTWGDTVNDYITKYVDASVAGTQTISGNQTSVTLTTTTATNLSQAGSGATGSAQYAVVNCTGNPASTLTITAPAQSKAYIVINATSTSQSITFRGAGPTTGVTVASGERCIVAWNGSDFVKVVTSVADGVTSVSGTGTVNGITLTGTVTSTGSLTLGGTLSNVNLTSQVTGTLPVANGGTGITSFGTGVAGALGTNVGSAGAFVVNGGALGTPSTGTLTNATGLPLSTGVTGTLAVANGGTGATSLTANNVLLGNGTSAVQVVAPGSSGNLLTSNGTTWTSAAPPASGNFTATASGSISAGAPVLINSSGQAYVQTNTLVTGYSAIAVNGSNTGYSFSVATSTSVTFKIAFNSVIGTYRQFWKAVGNNYTFTSYGTINTAGTTYTGVAGQNTAEPGSNDVPYTDEYGLSQVIYIPSTNQYNYLTVPNAGNKQLRISYAVDGPTGAISSSGTVNVGDGAYTGSPGINNATNYELAASSNGKIAVVWSDTSYRLFCAVATVSASSPYWTWGSMFTINSGGTLNSSQWHVGVAWNANNNEFVVTYADSSSIVKATLISVSGTTCTLQSTANVASSTYPSSDSRHSVCFVSPANAYIFAFYTNSTASSPATANSVYLVAATSSGTALTFGSIVDVYPYGTPNSSRRNTCYLYPSPVITNSFFLHSSTDGSTGNYDNLTVCTVSGTTITIVDGPLSYGLNNGGGYASMTYAPTLGVVANAYSTGGASSSFVATYRYTSDQDNNFAGFSSASYTNGQTVIVNSVGGTNTQQSGLLTGKRYWFQLSGSLGAVPSNSYAGQALSATSILVKG